MFEKIIAFIFGSCVGSFLNVCIYRLPKDKSIIKPGSACPKCNNPLSWYDNIPFLSYIMLRAKCRNCHQPISLRYPFVELVTAFIFLGFYMKFGFSLAFGCITFLFCLLLLTSLIDIDYHAIPGYLCPIGIVTGLSFSAFASDVQNIFLDISNFIFFLTSGVASQPVSPFFNAILGLLFGLGFTYLFKLFGDVFVYILLRLRKEESIEGEKESLGLGDIDFMGMVGVFLGIKGAILVFFIAPFFAVFYSIFAIIFKKSHLIPYLPYLSLATVVTFFWGNRILNLIF